MDPNTARQVLRLDPDTPLTSAAVESAYARESWERHPSRYPDEAGREAALAWAATLAQARSVLLQSVTAADVPRGRRRRIGLVVGIVAASAGVIALIVGAAFGATRLGEQLADRMSVLAEEPEWTGETLRYSADETVFTFPAAMEEYYDGRYQAECPEEFAGACWQLAVIPEASCASLEVDLEFTNEETAWVGDEQETFAFTDVAAGAVTPVVFGHHDYDWAWIADVRCLDEPEPPTDGPSTTSSAVTTPMSRLEAGRWASEDTGFYAAAALEFHGDGRLDDLCPVGFARGCWQATLVPEASCSSLRIQYTLRAGDGSELEKATWRIAEAGEPVHVVFGNDDVEYGWISHVACGA